MRDLIINKNKSTGFISLGLLEAKRFGDEGRNDLANAGFNAPRGLLTGFTLVELLVAMGLFVIFFSIATGGFIDSLRNQRIASALMAINDNASLSLEQMARELRTGYGFDYNNGAKELIFTNSYGDAICYRFNGNNSSIERGVFSSGNCANYQPMTADNVKVSDFNLDICGKNWIVNGNVQGQGNPKPSLGSCGSGGGTNFPPRLTVALKLTSASEGLEQKGIYTAIQTTVSARNF